MAAPTHDDFLLAWIDTAGEPAAMLAKLRIPPTVLFAMLDDPKVRQLLDAHEKFLARHARIRALTHQNNAAQCIASGLNDASHPNCTPDPADRRKTAATLARIAHQTQTAARHILKSPDATPTPTSNPDHADTPATPETAPQPTHPSRTPLAPAINLTPAAPTTHTSLRIPSTASDLRNRAGAIT